MNSLKNRVFAAAIIAGLAVIGSLMNSQQSTVRAAGGPTVTIDPTQLPLPVQGSLGVSGTVAATQSGAWNVGITGTPTVHVGNAATSPVLVRDVDNPARKPFAVNTSCVMAAASNNCNAQFSVPAGSELVIENVSVSAAVKTGERTVAQMQVSTNGAIHHLEIPLTFQGSFSTFSPPDQYTANQSLHAYADPGSNVVFIATLSVPLGAGGEAYDIGVFGYLVSCGSGSGCPIP